MVKDKPLKLILWSIVFALGLVLSLAIGGFTTSTPVNAANAYDISSYQGYVNDNQANQLKNEVNFMILKAENGGLYTDPQFNHNAYEMSSHNIPYGAYDYSLYANPEQAQSEAHALYQRAPQADFYVNDAEENDAGNQFNASTQEWANEIHQLTNKPAVLYSGLSFMNNNMTPQTRNAYNALWIAAYGAEPGPAYHYDLWQYTDQHYSPALGQSVDASVFPNGNNKPLSFWTDNGAENYVAPNHHVNQPTVNRHRRQKPVVKPRNNQTKRENKVNRRIKRQRRNYRKRARTKAIKRQIRKMRRKARWRARRKARKSRVKIIYNPNYYRSKRVRQLKVIGKNGINLYTMRGKYFARVAPGTVLNVYRYLTVYHRKTGYMTKAVGIHWGHHDLFTSRKDLVHWYKGDKR